MKLIFPKICTFLYFRRSKHDSHLDKRTTFYRIPFDYEKLVFPENDSPYFLYVSIETSGVNRCQNENQIPPQI